MNLGSLNSLPLDALQTITGASGTSLKEKGIGGSNSMFDAMLNSAIDNIKTVNELTEAGKEEKIKLAIGESENTHDLTIALQKASTALEYTVAVRDKFMAAYKEIMQMQI